MSNPYIPDISNTDETEERYLTFWSNGQLFGVSIENIMQIVGIQKITRLPDSPAYFKGVMNLRSSIVPVIDISLRVGNSETPYTERSCTIIAKLQGALFGFIVDEVVEVLDISPEQISPPPCLSGDVTTDYLTGIGRLKVGENEKEKVVLLLNLPTMFSDGEF